MKFFATAQIREIDQYTIEHETIRDIELMERASLQFTHSLLEMNNLPNHIWIFCGPGNNGGDGLAIARILAEVKVEAEIEVKVFILNVGKNLSESAQINLENLLNQNLVSIDNISEETAFPVIPDGVVVIDALFGSGLTRPLNGLPAKLVQHINRSCRKIIAVDIPSGLMGENNSNNIQANIIQANTTITFQFPKLSFLLPENEKYVGRLLITDIGLHPDAIASCQSNFHYLEEKEISALLKPRAHFSHKGNYGHALLIAGSYGMMGAAVLATKSCLRSGVGLVTTHIPHNGYSVLQTAVPEAMCSIDESDLMFTNIENPNSYSAVGIGPAIGLKVNTQRGVRKLIKEVNVPMVIDADGINILGINKEWLQELPPNTILTPHPKEFERIAGETPNAYARLMKAIDMASKHQLIIVLKGAYTAIVSPNGQVYFNSTGNPGMATAGSGDTLTGIILSLLAQGYAPLEASLIGVYVHGMAGDHAANEFGQISLLASDIAQNLGKAFKLLQR